MNNLFDKIDPYGDKCGINEDAYEEAYEEYKRSLEKRIKEALTKHEPPITKEEAFKRLEKIDISFIEQYLRKKKLDNIK